MINILNFQTSMQISYTKAFENSLESGKTFLLQCNHQYR